MIAFGQEISTIEIAGTAFGIAGVFLTLKKSVWCFPTGLVNVALYCYLFAEARLYADALLQLFYVALLIYGWIQWSRNYGLSAKKFTAERTLRRQWLVLFVCCLLSTIALGTFFRTFTDASMPYPDAMLTSMSLAAQWMIAKRKIENWIVWIVADVLYVIMYLAKHLYLTTALYVIFIVLAFAGYREWKKNLTDAPY